MQHKDYLRNHTRGSSPPFQNDQPEDPAVRPTARPANPEIPKPASDPPETDVPDTPQPDEEPLWQDDGGEG